MKQHYIFQTGKFEGWEEKIYLCPAGQLTIGYGHNLERRGETKYVIKLLFKDHKITMKEGFDLLEDDMQQAIKDAGTWLPEIAQLSENRQYCVIDMSFNMGLPTLNQFVNTKKLIQEAILDDFRGAVGDWNAVANGMMNSRWYKQTGNRSKFLVELMRNDVWGGIPPVD